MSKFFPTFDKAIVWSEGCLIQEGVEVDSGRWQGIKTEGHPSLITKEIQHLQFEVPLWRHFQGYQDGIDQLALEIKPNREWADEHFEERVGGVPYNPDPSHERWPWWRGQDDTTKEDGQFTHTYSERFWPKHTQADWDSTKTQMWPLNKGIRYPYGDLNDLINLLTDEPLTRQAYLPIFFPEDTGAVHRGRTPCSLGYHFLCRGDFLFMWYDIRSCDAVRHFRDDLYLAVRLQLWVLDILKRRGGWDDILPGLIYFTAHSFHVHMGDYHHLREAWNDKMA
jgi:thymidylate synthase